MIQVAAAHISRSGAGHYLRIGPCALSAEGRAALVNALLSRGAEPGGGRAAMTEQEITVLSASARL